MGKSALKTGGFSGRFHSDVWPIYQGDTYTPHSVRRYGFPLNPFPFVARLRSLRAADAALL